MNENVGSSQSTLIIPHWVIQLTTISLWVPQTRLRLPQVNKQVATEASEISTPSSIFIFYFFLLHRTAVFALNQSEARFAKLGEYSQNMLSEAFMDPKHSFADRRISRTRFAKQKFAQLRTSYVRRTFFRFAENPELGSQSKSSSY